MSTPYTANINTADTTASFDVGRSLAGPDEYSNGLIDDLKIYYRVLESTEVDTSFTTGLAHRTLEDNLAIYPHPAGGTVTIGGFPTGSRVAIRDAAGKLVLAARTGTSVLHLSTADLDNGLYLIQVEHNGTVAHRKLVVDR